MAQLLSDDEFMGPPAAPAVGGPVSSLAAPAPARLLSDDEFMKPAGPKLASDAEFLAKPRAGILETAGMVGTQLLDAVTHHLPGAVAASIEGDNPYAERDWKDVLVERSRAKAKERTAEVGTGPTSIPLVGDRESIAQLGPSMGFSLPATAGGIASGLGAGAVGSLASPVVGTAAAWSTGTAAAGAIAYRGSTNQFVRDLRETVDATRAQSGQGPISDEEFNAKRTELAPLIHEYGLWEAVPEAAGQALGLKIITAPVKGAIGKLFGENVLTRFGTKAAALYATELGTETVTGQGQHNVQIEAGMKPGEQPRSWTSPGDLYTTFKEIAPVTVLQTTLMAGGVKAGQRLMGGGQEAQQPPAIDPATGVPTTAVPVESVLPEAAPPPATPQPESTIHGRSALEAFLQDAPPPGSSAFEQSIQGAAAPVAQAPAPEPMAGESPVITPPAGRSALEQILADPRPADEIRADRQLAANWQPTDDWQPVPLGVDLIRLPTSVELDLSQGFGNARARIRPPAGTRDAPVELTGPADVHLGAEQTAQPTPAQAEAGNFQKRHLKWQGRDISIETEAGAERVGKDGSWRVIMPTPYGHILGTKGMDGDPVDVYLGPDPTSTRVFIVDQVDPDTRKPDEHKTFVGFADEHSALAAYEAAFSDGSGPFRADAVSEMSIAQFKAWLSGNGTKKPVAYTAPRAAPKRKVLNLVEFLAQNGGIRDHGGELKRMGLDKTFVPGIGRLVRSTGRPLDSAREAAVEAGYLHDPTNATTTINDLLELLAEHDRGNFTYAAGDHYAAEDRERARIERADNERLDAMRGEVRDVVKAEGYAATPEEMEEAARQAVMESLDAHDALVGVLERNAVASEQELLETVSLNEVDDAGPAATNEARPEPPQAVEQPGLEAEPAGERAPARGEHGQDQRGDGEAQLQTAEPAESPAPAESAPSVEAPAAAPAPEPAKPAPVTRESMDRETFSAALDDPNKSAIGPDGASYVLQPMNGGTTLPMRYGNKGQERMNGLQERTRDGARKNLLDRLYGKAPTPAPKVVAPDNKLPEPEATPLEQAAPGDSISPQEPSDGLQNPVPAGDARAEPEDVQEPVPDRPTGNARAGEIEGSPRPVQAADGERSEGLDGVSEGAVREGGRGTGEGDDVRVSRPDDGTLDEPGRPSERPAAETGAVKGENFVIAPGSLDESRSWKSKAEDNVRAIELARKIEAEGRPATLDEQRDLARYVGWGGIKGAFPDADGKFAKGFEKIGERVKELLTETEYTTARRSIQYAHYTAEDIVRSMWSAAERFGFKSGKVFEPGMGVGNFAGMMPPDVAANTHYVGLELDHTTARIAKLLYPKWGVRRDDFTKAPLPENTFDLVIGNPPFADVAIKSDPKYAKHAFLLHDYFFAKSLDAVRPGGVLMFITSAGTMNKKDASAREYLADRADFVGAIRLPSNAFAKNAGTEVTTDIVILRKRLDGEKPGSRAWTETVERKLPNKEGKTITGLVNGYFANNPDMVLGEEGFFDKLYLNRYAVHAKPGFDLKAALAKAIDSLPTDIISEWKGPIETGDKDFGTKEKKEGTYYIGPKGELLQVRSGVGDAVAQRGAGVEGGRTSAEIERIRGLVPVRDALRAVYDADLNGDTENGDRARARLNKSYDAFVEKFGPINKAVIQKRRPNVIQQEAARNKAREEARYAGEPFNEGTFDPSDLIKQGATLSQIARARQEARTAKGQNFDEGDFDPEEMPDVVIDKRPNVDPFMDDPESYRLRAIERYDDANDTASKGPVFTENLITKDREPEIKSVNDAVLYVLNQKGRLDLEEIAVLSGKSESEAIQELGDRIYKDPAADGVWVTKEDYLSGNVLKKLALAKTAAERNPIYRRNVTALEAAQPMPLAPSQIHAAMGMPWIPPATIEEFAREHLKLDAIKVRYIPKLAQWIVSGDTGSAAAVTTWGTDRRQAPALMNDILNRQQSKIFDTVRGGDGKTTTQLNVAATQAAQDKANAIKEAFDGWIWADEARADKLAAIYNENYNNLVVRDFDGSYLTTPGISKHWKWRPHQTRVVARIIQQGNTYMAHAVGAGKTSAMIGAGMEMRRLGLVRKPMYSVPNHMLGQFTKEFYEQYPTAKIAVADERQFHTDRRKQFIANVAVEDLDAIIITHSAMGMIPISDTFQDGIVRRELDNYRDLLSEIPKDQENRITRSRIEKQIERLEQRLADRNNKRRDQVFTFEEMGVDFLFVDEAHLFRKLDFTSKMSNLKGITPEGSAASWDLYVKTLYLNSINPDRSLVMASGTPVTNTMAELYTLSRFMQPQELEERGLSQFDAWAGAFGEPVTELEQDAAGGYKPVTRFAKFVNVAELSAMARQTMDVVTSRQLEQYVTRPTLKNGKRTMNLAEKTPALERYQRTLAQRMEAISRRKGPPSKGDDILLSVINDGRHAAIDLRLAGVDPDGKSKLDLLIDNAVRIHNETKRQPLHKVKSDGGGYESKPADRGPATQMIFANLGLSGKRGFSVPDYIRAELARRGIPRDQVAYIYNFKSHVARQKLFNDMNEGKVRILIGSTAKMATGVNAQRRLYAIHNLDPLWYPADDEQRNGRGLRQGNMNPEIEIHDYSTKGTYDSTMWGLMEKKARFIQGFFEGDPSMRDMEDLGEASQYAQAKALTTNDPRLIKLTELKQELQKAERRHASFDQEAHALKSRRASMQSEQTYYTKRIAETEQDIKRRVDLAGDKFTGKVGGAAYGNRAEFGAAVMERFDEIAKEVPVVREPRKVAEIGGFTLYGTPRKWTEHVLVDAHIERSGKFETDVEVGHSAVGFVRSIESKLARFEKDLEEYRAKVENAARFLKESSAAVGKKFEGQSEIDRLRKEVRSLEAELDTSKAPADKAMQAEVVRVSSLAEIEELGKTGNVIAFPRREQDGAKRGAMFSAVPKGWESVEAGPAQGMTAADIAKVKEIVRRVAGLDPSFADSIAIPAGSPGARAWARTEATKAQGFYQPQADAITIALDTGHPRVGYHEAFHRLQRRLLNKRELAVLANETEKLRDVIRKDIARGPSIAAKMSREEVEAEAFAVYANNRDEGRPTPGLHNGVSRAWGRLWAMLSRLRNALRGLGYQTAKDIFWRAQKGEFAGRTPSTEIQRSKAAFSSDLFKTEIGADGKPQTVIPGAEKITDKERAQREADKPLKPKKNQKPADDGLFGDESKQGALFALAREPETATERQQVMQGFLARGQFIDRAIRVPFDWFGGLTRDGQWKPGAKLFEGASHIITSAKFSPESRLSSLNPFMETVRVGLVDRYGLEQAYVERERGRALDERAVMLQGAEVLKSLKTHSVGPAEAKVLQAILTGEDVNDADMGKLAEPIRAAIDQLGQEAVALGMVSAESFERNRGTYLHRVYQKYESEQNRLVRFVNGIMGSKRKKIIGSQYKGRGMFDKVELALLMKDVPEWHAGARGKPQNGEKFIRLDEMPTQQQLALDDEANREKPLRTVYWPADKAIPEKYDGFRNQGAFEVRGTEAGKIVIWRDFTKAERSKMGEILDARYTIGKTFMLMAHDLSVGKFYKDIAENEDWASTQPPAGKTIDAAEWSAQRQRLWKHGDVQWVRVPNTDIPNSGGKKQWGALAGKYVREEIWRDLNEQQIMQRPGIWRTLMTQWKLNKTARSPVVHMNNVMSNFMLMDLLDVRFQDLYGGIKSFYLKDQHYQEAFEHGAFGADMMSQEVRDQVLKPILEELERGNTYRQGGPLGSLGAISKFTEALWSHLKKGDQFLKDAYRIEDELFRMATYIRRRQLGDDPKQAADHAREQFIDYDIRAPWINMARNTVLPFISYTYRAAPLVARAIATRPWKLGKYFALAYAANALAYAMTGGDDDGEREKKERKALRDQEQGRTWIGVPKMLRIPLNDQYGNPLFLNVNRWTPMGDVFSLQEDTPAWLNLGGPLILAGELWFNRNALTGQDIRSSKTDNWWERRQKDVDHAWKSWMPSAAWVPGSWYWEKIGRSWEIPDDLKGAWETVGLNPERGTDRQGRPIDFPTAVASSFGVKITPVDVDDAMAAKGAQFAQVERLLEAEMRRLTRQHNQKTISDGWYNTKMNSLLKKIEKLGEKATETFK